MGNAPKQARPEEARAWIAAYLEALPADQQALLGEVRATIAAAVPDAVEAVGYGMPGFKYRGRPLMWYLAAKAHCSIFPGPGPIEAHRAELAGFSLSKGTIRFTPEHPLPTDLVRTLVLERAAVLDASASARTR